MGYAGMMGEGIPMSRVGGRVWVSPLGLDYRSYVIISAHNISISLIKQRFSPLNRIISPINHQMQEIIYRHMHPSELIRSKWTSWAVFEPNFDDFRQNPFKRTFHDGAMITRVASSLRKHNPYKKDLPGCDGILTGHPYY